jgi:hypothetical protein
MYSATDTLTHSLWTPNEKVTQIFIILKKKVPTCGKECIHGTGVEGRGCGAMTGTCLSGAGFCRGECCCCIAAGIAYHGTHVELYNVL